jgi:NosR/NirI family nitrous oxide reductase transcriptional regulator
MELTIPVRVRELVGRRAADRLLAVAAIAVLMAAWVYGWANSGRDVAPLVSQVLPGVTQTERSNGLFAGYRTDDAGERTLVGYAGVGEAPGYGGPVRMLVGVNPAGDIIGVQVVETRETPGFFRLLPRTDFFGMFLNRSVSEPLRLGQDIDAVSGATLSSEGVAAAVRQAASQVATDELNMSVPAQPFHLKFGIPEITLLGLYIVGYFGHRSRSRAWKTWLRRATLASGAVVLGFLYNKPWTLANVISLLSGYWPDWHNNLYWFLLIGGILFVTTAQGKNPYCSWFCPFGAVQEGIAKLTDAKLYRPRALHRPLQWLQRGLAFGAIAAGLALRQPGAVSYEPFGALFDFQGESLLFLLLALVLLSSLLIYRPFCSYLCPLDPVVDLIGEGRRWSKELWRRRGREA